MSASFGLPRCLFLLCLSSVVLLAAACSNKDPQAMQIVAKVDGEDISLRQLSALLAKADDVTPENIARVKANILSTLVEQQLAVNLALAKKLDHKSEVANAIEASRREILAQAALDYIVAETPKTGEEEAKRFYANNPALYAERRIFTLQEIVLKKPVAGLDKIRAQLATTKRMDDMAAWLRERGQEFSSGTSTRAAEQIAMAALPKLQAYKDGQMGLLEGPGSYTITQLLSARPQPISMPKALPAIALLLDNQHAVEAVSQAKKDMKASAKLEYLGEFAGGEAAFKAGTPAASGNADESDAPTEARAKAEAKIVEQGIKGL